MDPLRTTVVMKTDISGSTSRFRELLTADLQALLGEHRTFLARHAAEHGGRIIKPAGDGYWLEFLSVTGAAKAAIAVQEELRLAQPNRAQDRLSIRIVIALGDIVAQDDDFVGDVFSLATRVEAITPPDEIYLTAGARLALTSAEVQTKAQNCTSSSCWRECSALKSAMPSTPWITASPSSKKRVCRILRAASTIQGYRLVQS